MKLKPTRKVEKDVNEVERAQNVALHGSSRVAATSKRSVLFGRCENTPSPEKSRPCIEGELMKFDDDAAMVSDGTRTFRKVDGRVAHDGRAR